MAMLEALAIYAFGDFLRRACTGLQDLIHDFDDTLDVPADEMSGQNECSINTEE